MLELYENIKKQRLLLKMTQTDLAKKMGYADKSMIAKIEKGLIDLPQSKIIAFAKVLNTTPGELMGWKKTDNSLSDSSDTTIAYLKEHGEDKLIELYKKIQEDGSLLMLMDKASELSPEAIAQILRIIDAL